MAHRNTATTNFYEKKSKTKWTPQWQTIPKVFASIQIEEKKHQTERRFEGRVGVGGVGKKPTYPISKI